MPSIPKNCRVNRILSNENLLQLDPYHTPLENFLTGASTQSLYQANLRAQMNQTAQQGMASPSIINQGTADHAPGASSTLIQQPASPEPFLSQDNQNNSSELFRHTNYQIWQCRDLKNQVCLRTIRPAVYALDNKLVLFPELQTPAFLLFRKQILPPQ